MNSVLILPAGGTGKRFGSAIPKQFEMLGNSPIITLTLKAFENIAEIKKVIIPVHPEWMDYLKNLLDKYKVKSDIEIIPGGIERQDSVSNALKIINADEFELILVHDAVRPFVSSDLIHTLMATAKASGSAVPYTKPKDTIRRENIDLSFTIIDRQKLFSIQTPQVFQSRLLLECYELAAKQGIYSTDDAALIELLGHSIVLIGGEETNIKITTPFDKMLAESILKNYYFKN